MLPLSPPGCTSPRSSERRSPNHFPSSSASSMRPVESFYPSMKPRQPSNPRANRPSPSPLGIQSSYGPDPSLPPPSLHTRPSSSTSVRHVIGPTPRQPSAITTPTRSTSIASHLYHRPARLSANPHPKVSQNKSRASISSPAAKSVAPSPRKPSPTQRAHTVASPSPGQTSRSRIDYDSSENLLSPRRVNLPIPSDPAGVGASPVVLEMWRTFPQRARSVLPRPPPSDFQPARATGAAPIDTPARLMMGEMADKRWGPRLMEAQNGECLIYATARCRP